jgi:hypothetical protein
MTAAPAELTVKARLRNLGDGVLVITDDSVKFYVETGRFRKKRKIAREIPMADVESVERLENDLSIVCKENTDVFAIAQPSQVEPIHEKLTAALKVRTKETETKEAANQKQVELVQLTLKAIETVDSLFVLLKNLHGRIDWNLVETSFKQSEENVKNLTSQATSLCLDLTQLSAAVQERLPKEIAEKAYNILKTLHEHFAGLASLGENTGQVHPDFQEAKLLIQASYVLNDMQLGTVVGDDSVEKEGSELLKVLDDLAKLPGSKIDSNAVKTSFDKMCGEKEKQSLVAEEIRLMLEQQLKETSSPPVTNTTISN